MNTYHKVNMFYFVLYKVIIYFPMAKPYGYMVSCWIFQKISYDPKSHKKRNISQWSHIGYDQQVVLLSHTSFSTSYLTSPTKPS